MFLIDPSLGVGFASLRFAIFVNHFISQVIQYLFVVVLIVFFIQVYIHGNYNEKMSISDLIIDGFMTLPMAEKIVEWNIFVYLIHGLALGYWVLEWIGSFISLPIYYQLVEKVSNLLYSKWKGMERKKQIQSLKTHIFSKFTKNKEIAIKPHNE